MFDTAKGFAEGRTRPAKTGLMRRRVEITAAGPLPNHTGFPVHGRAMRRPGRIPLGTAAWQAPGNTRLKTFFARTAFRPGLSRLFGKGKRAAYKDEQVFLLYGSRKSVNKIMLHPLRQCTGARLKGIFSLELPLTAGKASLRQLLGNGLPANPREPACRFQK